MSGTEPLFFKDREQWRYWLERNHVESKGVWLLFYKKHTGIKCLKYDEAVEEALCFGWIDSRVKRIDEEKHVQRYTPRNPKSIWSDSNRKRVRMLIKEGRMKEAGLKVIRESKRNGRWRDLYTTKRPIEMPMDLKEALEKNPKARENFNGFASSYRLMYVYWVNEAKKEGTRARRIEAVVRRSEQNKRPGIE